MALMGSCCRDGGARKQGKYSLQVCWWKSEGIGLLSNLPFVCLGGMTKNNPAIDALPITSRTTSEIAVQQLLGDLWPMDHWQNLWRIKNKHGDIPPLFGAPGCRSSVFSIDWLHAADQGVSADFLANLMTTILAQWEGTEKEKLGRLFAHIQKYYKDVQAESRLDNLTAGMIRKDSNKSPKLRSKAGECRALIGWIPRACTDFLDPANPEHECYACLSVEHFDKDKLATAARKFLTIMNALESFCEHERRWRWKPKFHIWLHLCEESLDSPSLSWVYRDEDFGGSLSRISTRRGGNNTAQAVSAMVLNMFFARNEIPALEC